MGVIPRIRQNDEGKPADASLKYLTVGIAVFHERHYFYPLAELKCSYNDIQKVAHVVDF